MNAEEFNALTDTGKFRVVQDAVTKTERLKRLVAGIVRMVFEPDEIIEIAMRWAEQDVKQNQDVIK